jgi:hypothetical protein
MNVSGIYSNTGVKMIGANGTVSNTAITGNIISSQITSVANTQLTGLIQAAQIGSANATLVTSGTLPTARLPVGTVLQVVNATYSTYTSFSSATLTDLGLSATITPSSSANKILVLTNLAGGIAVSHIQAGFNVKLLRGSTIIVNLEQSAGVMSGTSTERNFGSFGTASYLDSPSTTSATTYKIQVANISGLGTIYVNNYVLAASNATCTMTLMEIAA